MSNPKKQNKMDLSNFQKTVYQSVDRKVVGTVREAMKALYGENARLAPAKTSVRSSNAKFTLKAYIYRVGKRKRVGLYTKQCRLVSFHKRFVCEREWTKEHQSNATLPFLYLLYFVYYVI
jgi:hypothetical protein